MTEQGGSSAHSTLQSRARDLGRDLRAAETLLGRMDEHLRARVAVRMNTRIATFKSAADDLRLRAGRPSCEPAMMWADVHALRCEVDTLLDECVLLLDGAAERKLEFDEGYCTLADALIDELVKRTPVGHWGSFTVVGRSEFYSRASRVIQVRFPATSIWDLPIVAHELAHFVGPALVQEVGLNTEHPLDRLFEELGDGTEQSWSWLQELFADACATHLIGPAYGFTCALAVFDPLLAYLPSETHPPGQQRIRIVAAMLDANGGPELAAAAARLLRLWSGLVDEAGGAEGREPIDDDSPFAELIVKLIRDYLPVSGWHDSASSESVEKVLKGLEKRPDISKPVPTLTDILNGAWLARLSSKSAAAVDDVAHQALTWIRGKVTGEV